MKKTAKFPSWCCQHCGEHIGWLGRIIQKILPNWHNCPDPYTDKNNWGAS